MASSATATSTPRLSETARHFVYPSGIVTTGWEPIEARLSDMAIGFDFWQQGMAKVTLGKRVDGKYAATIGGVVMSIPRQVGKTFSVGALLVAMAIEFPGLKVLWTAHRTRTATNTFQSMQRMVKRKRIWPHIESVRLANGEQEIRFKNGSVILFGAREQGFGRGFDEVDVIVFDEAQILTEKALEDMVASTNQARHPHGALIFFIGTPPRPVDPGEAFSFKRAKALSGKSNDMVYIEFAADPDADPDDRKQWAKANPSFPQRTPLESMLRLRENLPSDEAWRREALGIWDAEVHSEVFTPFTVDGWKARAQDVHPAGRPQFFICVAKAQRSAFIAVAASHEGVPHIGVADYRPGVAWLTARVKELRDRHPDAHFGAFAAGPVKSWAPTFAEFGVELKLLTVPETSSAFAHLQKAVDTGPLTHSPEHVFVDSLAGAVWRETDGGGFVLDWRKSEGDPAPFAAAAGAMWLLETQPSYDVLESVC